MAFTILFFFFFISLKSFCFCFEVFSGVAAGVGFIALSTSYYFQCKFYECCDNTRITLDESMLVENFTQNLFGQHLAESVIHRSLHGHFKSNPQKALVMSFHGLAGSGKNYAASMIANSIYNKGMFSDFVHMYVGTKDFPHKHDISKYQDQLREDIVKHTKNCARSLFIFDEIEKMPPGTLDALKPFIDYYEHINNVDYRKNIFIFLSNSGSSDIVGLALKFWAEGREREEITMKDMEPLINKGAFNENGGFQFSELLRSELIDVFVPFLPLEKKHVRKCVEVELKKRDIHPEIYLINNIIDQLVFFPPENELFSKSGCKRIMQKIDQFVY